ncbi:hypothetical protein AG1IA_07641 [Rhizoctonia solani AG-1 IA]|uniref:Polysaccharide biosynthesis domain-containing protein n=1 Tax=Thanatephorus cucumeris (strain AG1-IA) TaxID=983506 RepID=L8WPT2_THACA|nr:hypothetical protein AG1IA_07641 [Rhizoctonia solani AG-1 IA]
MSTKFDAEKAENLEEAVGHAQTYWQLLEAVPPVALKMDDEIYNDFIEQFPEYKQDPSKIEIIDEDELKSKDNKPRWHKFMTAYDKKIQDYTFGSLLRRNAKDDYTEQNTMFGEHSHRYLFDIINLTVAVLVPRMLGMNDHVHNNAKSSNWSLLNSKNPICAHSHPLVHSLQSPPSHPLLQVGPLVRVLSSPTDSELLGVLLVGDSTVTDGAGWGKGFCADTKGLARCTNLAVSGTTTVSWPGHSTEYQGMLTGCKTANTFAFVQFATNLEKLTNTIKNAGCTPILITPLARRVFSSSHTTTDILGPYAEQTIAVVLPLLADSLAYIQKLGKADSMKFNLDYDTTNKDTTHLNTLGSLYFGRIVADEVTSKVSALTPYITANTTLSAKIAAGTL